MFELVDSTIKLIEYYCFKAFQFYLWSFSDTLLLFLLLMTITLKSR